MTPSAKRVGRRLLVWMVALAAGISNFGNCVIGFSNGLVGDALIWAGATLLVAIVAANIESVKVFIEE